MASKKKLLQAAAGSAGGAGLDVDEVFSTYLYDGDSQDNRNIVNNIDLSGEGGLVWTKRRDATANHFLIDTERGTNKYILSNSTNAENSSYTNIVSSFNNNGYEIGSSSFVNNSAGEYVSWTFRKAPKFFDVVTYTGTGSAQNISHNLGSKPNFYVVKQTSGSGGSWYGYHAGLDSTYTNPSGIRLDSTSAAFEANSSLWNLTFPTSTTFTVGTSTGVNASGETYVAYLFAHNDGDGDFGPDGDQDIIKCGSYTGSGSSGLEVDLGFEPQWLLIKNASRSISWHMTDVMRGLNHTGRAELYANTSGAEWTGSPAIVSPTPTGFVLGASNTYTNYSGENHIYMAIRRGPLAEPENATDVFKPVTRDSSTGGVNYYTGFPVDLSIYNARTAPGNYVHARLTADKRLQTVNTNAEISGDVVDFQTNVGYQPGSATTNTNALTWNWRRAPSYFDVVCYTGNAIAGNTISHNLGVAPEMMWVKRRDTTGSWAVYHKDADATAPEDKYLKLESSAAVADLVGAWNDTAPTATEFTLGNWSQVNNTNNYIAFLFASLAGVSKVGSYTGNGTSQTIDCGFSAGARFVLLKRTDSAGQWQVYDTERGIVSGDDPTITLNLTNAELTTQDDVDPDNSGFIVNDDGNNTNTSGASYIFYAIA